MNTEKNYYDFLFLLTDDASLSKKLAAELVESDTDPEGFFNHHKDSFSQRGISQPHEKQALLYMLDVLGEADFVCELDWKSDAGSLNHAIHLLSRGAIDGDLISEEDEDDAEGMFELLELAEELLEEMDYGILYLDIESDSHPVALVKSEKLDVLEEMAGELFYE